MHLGADFAAEFPLECSQIAVGDSIALKDATVAGLVGWLVTK